MDRTYAEIVEAMENYFEGFYEMNVEKLKKVFHPADHNFSVSENQLVIQTIQSIYELTESRQSPKDKGYPRRDRILWIDKASEDVAMVKIEIVVPPKIHTDYQAVLRIDGEWKIVTKATTFRMLDDVAASLAH